MILDAIEAKRRRKGRLGGALSKDTIEFYEKKFAPIARVFGIETPIALVADYAAVGRYIAQRESEPGARNGTRVQPHTVSKELDLLRFALTLQQKMKRLPSDLDIDWITRKGEYAAQYEPGRRVVSWENLPLLLDALLMGSTQTVSHDVIARARALRHVDKIPIADIAAELGVSKSTVHYYLRHNAEPRRDRIEQCQRACWYIATGGRLSEQDKVSMSDHDLVNWRVYMRGTKSKKAKGWIPIAPPFRHLLAFALADRPTERVFTRWTNPTRALRLACERANIPVVSLNDIRRSLSTLLSNAGLPHSFLKDITRHETTAVLDRVYTVGDIESVERQLATINLGKGDSR